MNLNKLKISVLAFSAALFLFTYQQACLAAEEEETIIFRSDLARAHDGSVLRIGDKPDGCKIAPLIAETNAVRYAEGPAEFSVEPIEGIITIKFDLLGFRSTQQQDMIFINSDAGKPFVVIRNINSSARINGRHVISSKSYRYIPGFWHKIVMVLHTKKGRLSIVTDGKNVYEEKTAVNDATFTGIKFSAMPKIANFSISVKPLPPETSQEKRANSLRPALAEKISKLPTSTASEIRKKHVLSYHLEKLDKAIDQGSFEVMDDIIFDIEAGFDKDLGKENLNQVWLRPVVQVENNPYFDRQMNDQWFADFISKPDDEWKLPTNDFRAFRGLSRAYGTRSQANNATKWLLLYSHPQSPLKGKSELLIRALRRIDAYMLGYYYHETVNSNSHLNDFFALGPALMGAVMIQKNYPEMLLPKQNDIWMAVAKKAADNYSKRPYTGNYANADLGTSRIFINSALITGDKNHFAHGLKLAYSWADNIYDDGGSAYIAKQNESPGYHKACINIEFDNFLMTNDPRILTILKSVETYPISMTDSNLNCEWFTIPSWKQSWYTSASPGGHPLIYYITGNQYYKAISGADRYEAPKEPSIKKALMYKSYPFVDKTIPNNYTVYDNNIQGVRMNYGLYSAAMNGRVMNERVGKNTFVGLTISEPEREGKRAFSAALYGINAFPIISGKTGYNTVSKESVSVTLGRDFASLNADYTLALRRGGPTRIEADWKGRQSWIYLPDRMIGLIELSPDGPQKATAITLNLELGRTKKGAFDKSPLEKVNENEFKYGKLQIIIHDSNFQGTKISQTADGISADDKNRGPHADLHLTDEANSHEWSSSSRTYEGTYFAIVELKMAESKQSATVEKIQHNAALGLTVKLAGRTYTTIYNPTDTEMKIPTATFAQNGKTSLFSDRNGRTTPVSAEAVIPTKQSVLIVSGKDKDLHRSGIIGWKNFIPYFEKNMKEFETTIEND